MENTLQDIVPKLCLGDKKAFEIIFKKYAPRILNFSRRYFDNIEDCEEVTQEVFMKLWKNRQRIETIETFESFLFTIAKNHIYNVLRRKIHQKAFKELNLSHLLKESYSIEDEQSFAELFAIIKAITKTLPEQRRKIFILSRFKGLSNKEIAASLGISTNTVETHMRLALKKFREVLSKYRYFVLVMGAFCCWLTHNF